MVSPEMGRGLQGQSLSTSGNSSRPQPQPPPPSQLPARTNDQPVEALPGEVQPPPSQHLVTPALKMCSSKAASHPIPTSSPCSSSRVRLRGWPSSTHSPQNHPLPLPLPTPSPEESPSLWGHRRRHLTCPSASPSPHRLTQATSLQGPSASCCPHSHVWTF